MKNSVKERQPLALRLVKALYWVLVALSAIVVGLYIAYLAWVRPPEPAPPVIDLAPVQTVTPTDDPATDVDESDAEPVPTTLQRKESFHTFLLVGTDQGNGNADTIMVASYDVANGKVGVLSIPRDTLVDVSRTVKKINGAYGYGGVEQVMDEVSDLVGFQIDHYIAVDLRAFVAIVDAVGGVDFYVPVTMDYDDPLQDLHIHFQQGMQHLNGEEALLVARFRSGYSNQDIGRIETQQALLTALAKKVLSWQSVSKINEFVDIFARYVDTDLTVGNLAYFGIEALSLDLSSAVTTATLPGDGLVTYKGIPYYYELYPQESLQLINDLLNPYTTPITMDMANIFQAN